MLSYSGPPSDHASIPDAPTEVGSSLHSRAVVWYAVARHGALTPVFAFARVLCYGAVGLVTQTTVIPYVLLHNMLHSKRFYVVVDRIEL